ncbi:unnamed protein product [Arctia plantaginis]|uniref:Uncharacterized protein n=1 Tax=Arctia plantaginis TaxID=874455 RepID=A0A8S1AZW0_ARCPL|nr:unnamed protein product [Arctia plantaginis]CAB3252496.1 unnamed protein product [Arctia plantaginis]
MVWHTNVTKHTVPVQLRVPGSGVPVSMRTLHMPPSTTRPSSVASSSQARSSARPTSGPIHKIAPPAPVVDQPRPSTGEVRVSALPRPSRLPAPRRALRPPSVYGAAAGAAELEHY